MAMIKKISQAMQAAEAGSCPDMEFLAKNHEQIPSDLLVPTLQILCSVVTEPQAGDNGAARAQKALLCMTEILSDKRVREKRETMTTLAKVWPNILLWLHRITKDHQDDEAKKVQRSLSGTPRSVSAEAVVSRFLCSIVESGSLVLRRLVLNDRSIFNFIASTWLSQDALVEYGSSPNPRAWFEAFAPSPSILLSHLLTSCTDEYYGTRLLELAGDVDLIASSAIQRIRCALRAGSCASADIAAYTTLLYNLAFTSHLPKIISESIFAHNTMQTLSKVLRKLPHFVPESGMEGQQRQDAYTNIQEAVETVLKFLRQAMETAPSPARLRQAIRSDLLTALKNLFCSNASDDNKKAARYFVIDTIPIQLFSRAVVKDLVKQYKAKDLSISVFQYKNIEDIMQRWKYLEYVVKERAIAMCMFESARTKDRSRCHGCTLAFHPSVMKQCGSCRIIWYCSVTCQRQHWKVHRGCSAWNAKEFICLDSQFVNTVVSSDIRHIMPGLRRLASQQFPSTPFDKLVVRANYIGSPIQPMFSVHSIDVIHGAVHQYIAEGVVPPVGPGYVLAEIQLPYGGQSFQVYNQIDLSPYEPLPGATKKDRLQCGFLRMEKIAPDFTYLESVDWDEVDDIWARTPVYVGFWQGLGRAYARWEEAEKSRA